MDPNAPKFSHYNDGVHASFEHLAAAEVEAEEARARHDAEVQQNLTHFAEQAAEYTDTPDEEDKE